MKVDFGAPIMSINGVEPIMTEDKQPFTLSIAAINALLQPTDVNMNPAEKIRRARLAERAFEAKEVDLSVEEVALIRQAIGIMYPPLIVYRAFALLGGDPATTLKVV